MKNHLSLGRVGQTEIRVHLSMLLLLPYALLQFQPAGPADAVRSILLLLLLFLFILLHELGHTAAARLLGIEVHSIVLWPLGGLSQLSREPRGPGQTLLVTSAGPLVNLLLAAGFGVLFVAMTALDAAVGGSGSLRQEQVMRFVLYLAISNLLLAGFNLIPIYPLDGGRILHSLLELVFGRARADLLALFLGIPLAGGLILLAWRLGDWLLVGVAVLLMIGSASLNEKLFSRLSDAGMALTDRAAYYLVHRDFDPAIREYTRQIERRPQAVHLYTNRGQAHLYLGERHRARQDFERALALQPENVSALSLRGDLARAEGDLEQAQLLADQVTSLAPNWYKGHADQALAALERGSLPAALLHIEQALALENEAPRLYLLRAMIRFESGNLEGAAQDELQAVRLSPEDALILPASYRRLLRAHPAWTAQYYARAAQNLPASPWPQQGWGDALLALDHPAEAEVAYSAAIQRTQPNAELHLRRGRARLAAGMEADAALDLQQALALPAPAHLHRQARELLASG